MVYDALKQAETLLRSSLAELAKPHVDAAKIDASLIPSLKKCADDLAAIRQERNEVKKVYIAWSNTDRTEGRGPIVPLLAAECRATAVRKGRGQDVQGSNCNVTEWTAVRQDGHWVAPVWLIPPSAEDRDADRRQEAARLAMERLRTLGLGNDEIDLLISDLQQIKKAKE